MSPDFVAVYVLDSAANESVPTRIKLYRGLAQMLGITPEAKAHLIATAERLEAAQESHRAALRQFDTQRSFNLEGKQ